MCLQYVVTVCFYSMFLQYVFTVCLMGCCVFSFDVSFTFDLFVCYTVAVCRVKQLEYILFMRMRVYICVYGCVYGYVYVCNMYIWVCIWVCVFYK